MNITFKNEMNDLILAKMTAKEMDLFFALLAKFAEQNTGEIKFTFLEAKKMMGINPRTSNKQFINQLDKMIIKSHQTVQKIEEKNNEGKKTKKKFISVFSSTSYDEDEQVIESKLNADFKSMLTISEEGKFTIVDMKILTNFKSKYSKIVYRILKQWETKGIKEFKMIDFRNIVDISETYLMKEIDKKIFTPILKELTPFFPGLNIEKEKNGRGGKVTNIIFRWQKIVRKKKKVNKEIIQPQQLASGSKKKFDKDLALEKTARAEAEVQELKLKENNIIEIIESLKEKKEIVNDKPFISENEFENMYQEWLKLQGVQDNKLTKRGYRLQIQGQYQILENKKAL